jgi:flagellar biosynthetic protein FliQ
MTPTLASELFRSALAVVFQVTAPLLIIMTVTAVVFGALQASTQVQDASLSFTPKLAAALAVLWLGGAWMTSMMGGYMHKALLAIPWVVAG